MRRRTTATKTSHDNIDIATAPTLEAEGLDTLPAAEPRADSARVRRLREPDTTAQVQAVARGMRLSTPSTASVRPLSPFGESRVHGGHALSQTMGILWPTVPAAMGIYSVREC
jgi:hypothetical protein